MSRTMLNSYLFLFSLTLSLGIWPSCRGGTAAVTSLPNPVDEDRPPGSPPELPRILVELPSGSPGAPTRVLSEGDDLQRAVDNAKPGDVIALQPGAVFKGPLTLPDKTGSDWITIRTNAPDAVFPMPGMRVSPSYARRMPVIESDRDVAITAEPAAH